MTRTIATAVKAVPPSGIRRFFDIAAASKDIISLGVGEPDFDTPAHITRAGVKELLAGGTHYTSNWGKLELRQLLAKRYKRRAKADYDPETELLVTVGASEAVDLSVRSIADPGDEFVIADPSYVSYRPDILMQKGVPVAVTGWRLGYACGNAEVIGAMMKVHQYSIMCAPTAAQAAAVEALKSPKTPPAVEKMRSEYDRRRKLIVKGFNKIGMACPEPHGAFYAFPSIKQTGLTSDQFCERAIHEARVAMVPGSAFGGAGEGHIRASYATA